MFDDKRARGGGRHRHGRLRHSHPPRSPPAEIFSASPVRPSPNPAFFAAGSAILHIQRWVPASTLFLHANTFTNTRPRTCLLFLHCYILLTQLLWGCSCAAGKKSKKKKMKRVHFAEDVVESCRDGQEFRNRISRSKKVLKSSNEDMKNGEMPTNRVALYNGILRDRVAQRLAYSC